MERTNLARKKKSSKYDSELEESFLRYWTHAKLPPPVTQHKFHQTRLWRFDFAWLEQKVAVEIQGFGEGHNSYEGMKSDYEKLNAAVALGWKVLYFMSHHINDHNHRLTMTKEICYVIGFDFNSTSSQRNLLPHERRRRIIEEHNRRSL